MTPAPNAIERSKVLRLAAVLVLLVPVLAAADVEDRVVAAAISRSGPIGGGYPRSP